MKTRVWHIGIALIFVMAFIGVVSVGLSGRAAQAMEADKPIGLPKSIEVASVAPSNVVCGPEAPVAIDANNLQMTFMAQADAHVRQNSPTVNYSNTTYLRTGRILAPSEAYQTLVQFDIASLPANATIVTATLELYAPVSSTPNIRTYMALSSWTESTVNWNNKPTYSADYGSQTVSGLGWHKWNVTSLVQQWQSGTRINYGFLLAQAGTTYGTLDYDSSENASLRIPRLTVIYATQGSPAILPVQADTWINQALPSNNYGTDSQLYVGRPTGNARNTLLKFDTSSLPSSVVVISASLELYSEINLLNAPEAVTDIWADAVISTWNENTVNWTTRPVTQAMGDLPKAYATGWLRWDVSNLVRGWYSGTIENYGIQLRLDPTGTGTYSFYALPANSSARLVIAYHTCAAPLTGVSINGATTGVTGTQYTFSPVPVPVNATTPITYTWRTTDLICGGSHQPACPTGATFPFTFTTTGAKTITVTAQNCGGSATDTHQITISAPPPSCPNPISDVSVIGVSSGLTGTNYTFTATASPIAPTTPITFTWQASDQAPQTTSGTITQTTKTYTWNTSGPRTITVTAQNCGTQSAAQATKAVSIEPLAGLPDLIVSSMWYDAGQGKPGYVLKNIGGGTAEPAGGYSINIYQNDVLKSQGLVTAPIPPGGIRADYINYTWACPGITATAKLLADPDNVVLESTKLNNSLSDVWACNQSLPSILNVKVDSTGEHTATIKWLSEPGQAYAVKYGQFSGAYGSTKTGTTSGVQQTTQLTGLEADRVYHFAIVVTGTNGLVANSPDYVLETKPLCSDLPQLSNLSVIKWPSSMYEYYLVRVLTADPACVDRVSFFMDNIALGTDYTPDAATNYFNIYFSPANLGLARADFFKAHTFKAEVRNKQGSSGTPLTNNVTPASTAATGELQLFTPNPDTTVYVAGSTTPAGTTLPVSGKAYQYEWPCTWSGFSEDLPDGVEPTLCGDVALEPQSVSIGLTGSTTFFAGILANNSFEHAYSIANKPIGTYTLKVCARATSTELDCVEQPVNIVQGNPTLAITRTVTRQGNFFRVDLGIKNNGTVDAYLDTLSDEVLGFQPADVNFSGNAEISTFYRPITHKADVDFQFVTGTDEWLRLTPGNQRTISYVMIPIMYETGSSYGIGTANVRLCYMSGSGTGPRDCEWFPLGTTQVTDAATGASESLIPSLFAAYKTSDYLLTTNPGRLYDFYTDVDVPPVLATMATLAYYKNGVIGYLDTYGVDALDNIVEKNGAWKQALHPDFFVKNKGYLLIVGETEIVPAHYAGPGNFTTYPGIPDKVRNTDLWYANTAGETARPELVVGRIVGNNPSMLINGMSGAIAVADGSADFDRSHALLVSGRGEGVTSNFMPTVDIIADELRADGVSVSTLHSYLVTDPHAQFVGRTPDRDVIFYRDHGNEDEWSGVLSTSQVLGLDFGNTRPVAFAAACLAGNFEDTDDVNLPDAFMNKGVGAYIASTELSERGTNDFASKYFFRHWPIDQSAGVALNNTRIAAWDDDGPFYDHGKLWAFEYQLYGDPKFGKLTTTHAPAGLPNPAAPTVPVTALQVNIPDYVVEHIDGYDRVSLPGGLLRLEPGRYEVPYWQVQVDYPKGTRVSTVTLTSLSTPVITTGLHLITTTNQMDCEGCPVLPPPPLTDTATWAPPLDPKY
ncbi:MAG: DNRLRE domain-containing protein, partial [Chloroflexi bacterium]|nr:DNRLRE domain-containing protein [Chloroflexota bacterium]